MHAKVLIIDDEAMFREDMALLIRKRGFSTRTASNADEGVKIAREFSPDIVLCDIIMPGRSGVDILDEILSICPESSVIMMTAYGSLETAVESFRKGASDYITKPLILEDVIEKIHRLMKYKSLSQEVKFLRRQASREVESLEVVGKSDGIKKVMDLVRKVAPTKSTVLLTGESGTGKEVIARAIHALSESSDNPFVAINCASIPDNLIESELFGHVRGAFTGADLPRAGFFKFAGDGTIFLDEISEMSPGAQSKLLRVLEQREFSHVGDEETIPLKARVVVSTNKDLRELVRNGLFREDLMFRIAVFEIHLPPLRERRSDIPLLVQHFIQSLNLDLKRRCLGVDNDTMRILLTYDWPGNIRELRNVIERAIILIQGEYITGAELPAQITQTTRLTEVSDSLKDAMRVYESMHIQRVLESCKGNKEETARRLGVNPSTLYRKLADLGISTDIQHDPPN